MEKYNEIVVTNKKKKSITFSKVGNFFILKGDENVEKKIKAEEMSDFLLNQILESTGKTGKIVASRENQNIYIRVSKQNETHLFVRIEDNVKSITFPVINIKEISLVSFFKGEENYESYARISPSLFQNKAENKFSGKDVIKSIYSVIFALLNGEAKSSEIHFFESILFVIIQ